MVERNDLVGQVDHSVSTRERQKSFNKITIAVFVGACSDLRWSESARKGKETSDAKIKFGFLWSCSCDCSWGRECWITFSRTS